MQLQKILIRLLKRLKKNARRKSVGFDRFLEQIDHSGLQKHFEFKWFTWFMLGWFYLNSF